MFHLMILRLPGNMCCRSCNRNKGKGPLQTERAFAKRDGSGLFTGVFGGCFAVEGLETLAEVGGGGESGAVGDFADGPLPLFQQGERLVQPEVPDQLRRGRAEELLGLAVEVYAREVELPAEVGRREAAVRGPLFEQLEQPGSELFVEADDPGHFGCGR